MKTFLLIAANTILLTGALLAEATPASADVANHQVSVLPANIAKTPVTEPKDDIQVFGEVRNSVGHPCTYLDKEDVDNLKKALTTNAAAKAAFATLKASVDARMTKPLNVPGTHQAADGSWICSGDFPSWGESPFLPGFLGKEKSDWLLSVHKTNEANGLDMDNLGTMYQLTGDEKYAEYSKKMLLAYADGFYHWGHVDLLTPGQIPQRLRREVDVTVSGRWRRSDRIRLCLRHGRQLAVRTPAEKAHMRDDLFKNIVGMFIDPAVGKLDLPQSAEQPLGHLRRRSALMAGYACEDQGMINDGLLRLRRGTKEALTGGTLKAHFGEGGILPDGLWVEGAPGAINSASPPKPCSVPPRLCGTTASTCTASGAG